MKEVSLEAVGRVPGTMHLRAVVRVGEGMAKAVNVADLRYAAEHQSDDNMANLYWWLHRQALAADAGAVKLPVTVTVEQATAERNRHMAEAKEADRRAAEDKSVSAERSRTAATDCWWPIPYYEVPTGMRFDTPRIRQGQIVEVSFGTFGRSEASESSSEYMRISDGSDGSVRYYRRREVPGGP